MGTKHKAVCFSDDSCLFKLINTFVELMFFILDVLSFLNNDTKEVLSTKPTRLI